MSPCMAGRQACGMVWLAQVTAAVWIVSGVLTCSAGAAEAPVLLDGVQGALLHRHLQEPRTQEPNVPASMTSAFGPCAMSSMASLCSGK